MSIDGAIRFGRRAVGKIRLPHRINLELGHGRPRFFDDRFLPRLELAQEVGALGIAHENGLIKEDDVKPDAAKLLHAEQEFEWSRHPEPGETVSSQGRIASDISRRGMNRAAQNDDLTAVAQLAELLLQRLDRRRRGDGRGRRLERAGAFHVERARRPVRAGAFRSVCCRPPTEFVRGECVTTDARTPTCVTCHETGMTCKNG